MPDYERIANEFGFGRFIDVSALSGGGAEVMRVTTSSGVFVLKPADDGAHLELAEEAAQVLAKAGLRQAGPLRTLAGGLVSDSGFTAAELLPGALYLRPTRAQALAIMRYLAAYHVALADVAVPPEVAQADTIWTRVTTADYLFGELPGLFDRFGPPGSGGRVVATALGQVESSLSLIRSLPRQLVHGDVAPDNVLMDGDEVVAFVDFTPHYQPVVFAAATAVYWCFVHAHPEPDVDVIWASFDAALDRSGRPDRSALTDVEQAVWPSMLLMEALRRLATPLALAAERGTDVPPNAGARYDAVAALIQSWPRFSQARR
ncbi:MAG TPA: phosphotransferase [Streptosporangiaceae bacterium]|nr:phosphotransferase [Streptosporangiaceae bacterium]